MAPVSGSLNIKIEGIKNIINIFITQNNSDSINVIKFNNDIDTININKINAVINKSVIDKVMNYKTIILFNKTYSNDSLYKFMNKFNKLIELL